MLAQSQARPISKVSGGEEGEKERRLNVLAQELDYLRPRRHRYFCKPYKIDADPNEVPLLLRDMDDYRQLLGGQAKKILAYLHDYQLDGSLNSLLASLLYCFEELAAQGARTAGRLARREEGEARAEAREGRCSECSRVLSEYRVEQLKEELQLNRFEDHYKLFNVDHLNFQELGRLQRESKALLQGELAEESQFVYQGGCISLEQYEEVLNLLGSDLHQKNASIEKIIDYLSKTDKRLLGEDKVSDREGEEELRRFDALVAGDSIKERLRDMIKLFFKRYLKYKIYKRKDAEAQVNFKENDVIRELEREKKHLKNRIYVLTTEKERMAMDYESKLRAAHLELQANTAQFREQMGKAAEEAAEIAQRFAEEKHLHDLHKLQLQHMTNEYTNLMAVLNRRSINIKEKDSRSSRGSKRGSSRRSKKEKPKIAAKPQRSSFADMTNMTNIDSDNDLDSESGKNTRKSRGKEGSSKKLHGGEGARGNGSLKEIGRLESYSRIEEKQEEEEEAVGAAHKGLKRKTSRFKALMSHFNSNATLQQEASKPHIERPYRPSLNATHQPTEPPCPPEQSLTGKQSEESRYEMIYRLFENERSSQQLTLPFPNFLQLYNDFITTISSEKLLRRSSSLKPRASRLGSNYEKPALSRTANSIDEELGKESVVRRGGERMRNSSKLQPIEKKSQYYLKKAGKKMQFDFKNYSRTAEQTLRNHTEHLVSIKDVQIESSHSSEKSSLLYANFSDSELGDIFLGSANILRFQAELNKVEEPCPAENQFLMKIYAELAGLHIKNAKAYGEVRTVLVHPREAVEREAVGAAKKENVNELKNAMKCLVRLHRKCRREKGRTECAHLQRLLAKIRSLSSGDTSLKVVEQPSQPAIK